MPGSALTSPRVVTLVGPYLSGKTTLMESMLHASGSLHRRGSVKDGNSVGDPAPEARAHGMSIEMNLARTNHMGQDWTIIDCPGSIEFSYEAQCALMVTDMAIVVCEAQPDKVMTLAPLLHFLDANRIPHAIFLNKLDHTTLPIAEILEGLQAVSERPLVLREVPIRENEEITGYVDLVSERAYAFQEGKPSKLIQMPDSMLDREADARQEMLEKLADFDDGLLEKLLEDVTPSPEEIFQQFEQDLGNDLIVPVFLGSAEHNNGIIRLMKMLRHDCPGVEATADRLGASKEQPLAQVFKTHHLPHMGKISLARIWRGTLKEGDMMGDLKMAGLALMTGHDLDKTTQARAGDIVAIAKLDPVRTGDVIGASGVLKDAMLWPDAPKPVYATAIATSKHEDEVKLSTGLSKLAEEDPSLATETEDSTHQLLVWGQGEQHLKIQLEKLVRQYHLEIDQEKPEVAYKETIRASISQHARHKKQSGGHGEFGDVHLEIKPQPRGSGFSFDNRIVGGSVPKQYIPAVEHGVKDFLIRGPLGFPVVDIAVTLTDGQHHNVDSSDMSFRKAAAQAMRQGTPQCDPVLLEPIYEVKISVPNDFTSNAQTILSKRRGQILGFDAKSGWTGWDEVTAYLPQSEMQDLIIEIRSQTQGVGWFDWDFAHLSELTGRLADQAITERQGD
ncbi:elongation factor G [Aestuariispira insulae]|uniref:Elongation factor G n=1 Tax=Aestuariispira insulae TaxID=1461337 RepID=A0A3D9HXV1_9PROT|nr:elongation factor G [Aestuariispira insulae]RED54333.1 translation elongation factor 2 (EF-2/EF-G) [Aestuariispira insulae]